MVSGLMADVLAARATTGRKARDNGEALEAQLDEYHRELAARGTAFIRRVGTPVKVLGKVSLDARGRSYFRAAFDGHQGCDFIGFDNCGIVVALEAKNHAGARSWDCGVDPDGEARGKGALQPLQWAELCRVEKARGFAFVILRAFGSVWRLRPDAIRRHVETHKQRAMSREHLHVVARELQGVRWW